MARPVAIVTGASSGIGLALTKHLLERKWKVVMADVNPPEEDLEDTLFVQTDVSSWDEQASMFKKAYACHSRVDFVALNAGIDDRDDIFNTISGDVAKPPKQPNMKTVEVNLTGTYYGVKLAAHYLSLDSAAAGKPKKGGKIVVTASAAGIYPLPGIPQYTASKHGLVGLVRSMGPMTSPHDITINAVCPDMVVTKLAPPGLLDHFKQEQLTPMSTILNIFSELADIDGVDRPDWVETGKNGEVVEGSLEQMIYHPAPARPGSDSDMDAATMRAWAQTYTERNKKFAMQDWQSGAPSRVAVRVRGEI